MSSVAFQAASATVARAAPTRATVRSNDNKTSSRVVGFRSTAARALSPQLASQRKSCCRTIGSSARGAAGDIIAAAVPGGKCAVRAAHVGAGAGGADAITTSAKRGTRVMCNAVVQAEPKVGSGGVGKTLYLGMLFALWYAFSVGFGVYNKQVLNVFPHPTTLTLLNLFVGSCIAGTMWLTGVQQKPKVTKDMLLRIAPLAVVHTIGNLLTNISLGKVAVSFTHTIKSCEPFFSVVFSAIFLGDMPSALLVLSLVPVVGGIALASFSEPSFNWIGLFAALGSNITFTSRNVFSKKVMGTVKDSLDNINLFSIITIMSMVMCAPVTLLLEGVQLTPTVVTSPAFMAIAGKALLAGICFHSYQQVSYMVLQNVSPVTHSVGKCVKSVVVIVASIIVFQNPIGPLNVAGTAIALLGVCCYSAVKIRDKKRKEEAAAAAAAATN